MNIHPEVESCSELCWSACSEGPCAAVMPCFDKKLEASREDFKIFDGKETNSNPDTGAGAGAGADEGTSEVDCVLTTGEAGPGHPSPSHLNSSP